LHYELWEHALLQLKSLTLLRNVPLTRIAVVTSPYHSLTQPILNERFYEKVIKVKADVAALLNLFSDVSIDVRW
jgi:hypothetical protein